MYAATKDIQELTCFSAKGSLINISAAFGLQKNTEICQSLMKNPMKRGDPPKMRPRTQKLILVMEESKGDRKKVTRPSS